MSEVGQYIERGARRSGFKRDAYAERNIPTVHNNVLVLPFYGDLRATCILSSFVLKEYKKLHSDKYLVLCTWPGYRGLFPYVDEFWSLEDSSVTKGLALDANNFYNRGELAIQITRKLVESFEVIASDDLTPYYDNGFGQKYLSQVGDPQLYLPQIASASRIGPQFKAEMDRKTGNKLVVYPTTRMRTWQRGKLQYIQIRKEFWTHLFERLFDNGIVPVVYQNHSTYDMSRDYADRCIYVVSNDITELLAAINHVGCALDVFSGFSRLATIARTPCVCVDERSRYVNQKDYEIDDLCGSPHEHIFAFSTMLLTGSPKDWDNSFVDNILVRLKLFLSSAEKDWLPLTEHYVSVPYEKIKERKARRMGVHFVRTKHHWKELEDGQCRKSESGASKQAP